MSLTRKPKSKLQVKEVALSKIKTDRSGLRVKPDPGLIESIKEIGLINPLTINKKFELIAGGRRYAAVRALGWKKVPVVYYQSTAKDKTELHEELAHIDENLIRLDLTDIVAEDAIARRKAIYEELHPETKHGGTKGNQHSGKTRKSGNTKSFTEDTTEKTGKSKSAIEDAVRRSQKASPKLRRAREDGTITATQATEMVKLSEEVQEQIVPLVENKSVAETKQIVSQLKGGSLSTEIKDAPPENPTKLCENFLIQSSRLLKTLSRIISEKIVFEEAAKRLEVKRALTNLLELVGQMKKIQKNGVQGRDPQQQSLLAGADQQTDGDHSIQ